MFYKFIITAFKLFFGLFNGKPIIKGSENIPKDQAAIFAATHTSNFDPFYVSMAIKNHTLAFMAKESLFSFKPLAFILSKGNVFPVNRDKPSSKTMRHAVNVITKEGKSLGIFPTGSRHSQTIRSGTSFFQRMTKAPIVPIAVKPQRSFWEFISRKKAIIYIGEPIYFDPKAKYNKQKLKEVDQQLVQALNELNQKIDPTAKVLILE